MSSKPRPEIFEKKGKYNKELDEFAFSEKRDYFRFRKFLARNSAIFRGGYSLLKTISDREIDYVFARLVEERQEVYGAN